MNELKFTNKIYEKNNFTVYNHHHHHHHPHLAESMLKIITYELNGSLMAQMCALSFSLISVPRILLIINVFNDDVRFFW